MNAPSSPSPPKLIPLTPKQIGRPDPQTNSGWGCSEACQVFSGMEATFSDLHVSLNDFFLIFMYMKIAFEESGKRDELAYTEIIKGHIKDSYLKRSSAPNSYQLLLFSTAVAVVA